MVTAPASSARQYATTGGARTHQPQRSGATRDLTMLVVEQHHFVTREAVRPGGSQVPEVEDHHDRVIRLGLNAGHSADLFEHRQAVPKTPVFETYRWRAFRRHLQSSVVRSKTRLGINVSSLDLRHEL
jgi:hypothetical protein